MNIIETYFTYKFILDIAFTTIGIVFLIGAACWHIHDERKMKRK